MLRNAAKTALRSSQGYKGTMFKRPPAAGYHGDAVSIGYFSCGTIGGVLAGTYGLFTGKGLSNSLDGAVGGIMFGASAGTAVGVLVECPILLFPVGAVGAGVASVAAYDYFSSPSPK